MNEDEKKKFQSIALAIKGFEKDFFLLKQNKNHISDFKVSTKSRSKQYLKYREYIISEGRKLKKKLLRDISFFKEDIGELRYKEIKNCLQSSAVLSNELMRYLKSRKEGSKLTEYRIVYSFLIHDLEKYNSLIRSFSQEDSSLKDLFRGSEKQFFLNMLGKVSSHFITSTGRMDYNGLIELIWHGTFKGRPIPLKDQTFLRVNSNKLTGFTEVPNDIKLLKDALRLRIYRFRRKENLQK